MLIVTPTEIISPAWEGNLVASGVARVLGPSSRLMVTLGQPEIWPAADALESMTGQKWSPPVHGGDYWLVRLSCTLRPPKGRARLTEAEQRLYLRPHSATASKNSVYAQSLFPDRLDVEDRSSFKIKLGPELKFADALGLKLGEVGAEIQYRKAFPVIRGYGAGEAMPAWQFKAHPLYPLTGSQFVYVVVAARPGAEGVRAAVELVATVETAFGPLRLAPPKEAQAHLAFNIP
jgi:hypothetical protein